MWAGIKTFGTIFFEKLNCARECPRFYLPYLESYDILCCQVFSVSGSQILIDILLLGYFCQSINQLDVTISCIKCHQQIKNSIQLNHTSKMSGFSPLAHCQPELSEWHTLRRLHSMFPNTMIS